MLKIISIAICTMVLACHVLSQSNTPTVSLSPGGRDAFVSPWAGGMNACQFGQVDINRDGVPDLVAFDRCGNRIMPFIFDTGWNGYAFAPDYAGNFPELFDWAIFADYDKDGKTDIFTYSPGYAGMMVYRNVTDTHLEFKRVVFPYLTSFQGSGYTNILVTYADYPAIADLDGDGDLDILTFWGLGSFVEMHRNMSVETYGNCDSLEYFKGQLCWGFFAESEESNVLTLDTCIGWEATEQTSLATTQNSKLKIQNLNRHTGSTFQVLDLNGDGYLDLLLGDVDYPNVVALYVQGTAEPAVVTSYDWNFPPDDVPVNLFSMPSVFYGDVDHDDKKDLVVSPFDPNPVISANVNSVWLYQNQGGDSGGRFHLIKKAFLQEDMIDVGAGAYPVLFDYDRDGLQDLFIGNFGMYDSSYYDQYMILHTVLIGKIALFRNTGNINQPSFTLITDDFGGMSGLELTGLIPAFGDLDGDGDADVLAGNVNGTLCYYKNIAAQGQPMELSLQSMSYKNIDVGDDSAPVLFDLDGDGFLDLIVGERGGNLNYYRNAGTLPNPVFNLTTDSLGKINVTDYNVSLNGYSVPCLSRDEQGHVCLLVGSEQGKIFYYPDIESDLSGRFEESDALPALLQVAEFSSDRGYRTGAGLSDLDHDGIFELVAGNFSGGVEYFSKYSRPPVLGWADPEHLMQFLDIYPNPTDGEVNLLNKVSDDFQVTGATVYDITGRMLMFRQSQESQELILDLSDYSAGLYLVKVDITDFRSSSSVSIIKKVLKKTKFK